MKAIEDDDESVHTVDLYISKDVMHPNKAVRKHIAKRWLEKDAEAQSRLRSVRALAGVQCSFCGCVGFYLENCPNDCVNRPVTPDSDDSAPPSPRESVGILWNKPKVHIPKKAKSRTRRLNIERLREDTLSEASKLEETDKDLESFNFFSKSVEGYSRSLPELTLHQVMRKLMRILKRKIIDNVVRLEATVDQTLLLPPDSRPDDPDYPVKLKKFKEYRPFFIDKLAKSEQRRKQHEYKGAYRSVDSLDSLFRIKRHGQVDIYDSDGKAGASMHSKVGWKSSLATGDSLAISDPKMVQKIQAVEDMCSKQGAWVPLQQENMKRKNDHFEHCAFVLRQEMAAEHDRESRLLVAGKSMSAHEKSQVWQSRLAAADRLMSTMTLYGMSNGIDEADYLLFNLGKWRELSQHQVAGHEATSALTVSKTAPAKSDRSASDSTVSTSQTELSTVMDSVPNPYGIENSRINADLKARGVIRSQKSAPRAGFGVKIGQAFLPSGEVDQDGKSKTKSVQSQSSSSKVRKKLDAKDVDKDNKGHDESTKQSDSDADSEDESQSSKGAMAKQDIADEETETSSVARSIARAKAEAEVIQKAERLQKLKLAKSKKKSFVVVHKPHQRDVDAANMNAAKEYFRQAGLERNIRSGKRSDVAYLAPTLIPVPKAFEEEREADRLSSFVGEKIISKVRNSLIRTDIGYTPQALLPLYVRNTLIEKNGTTPGGDQDQSVMATDRRYSHYIGRPLNRFEPGKELTGSKPSDVNEYGIKIKLAPVKALTERQLEKIRKKKLAIAANPISTAFVRFEFTKLPTFEDLYHRDELLCED